MSLCIFKLFFLLSRTYLRDSSRQILSKSAKKWGNISQQFMKCTKKSKIAWSPSSLGNLNSCTMLLNYTELEDFAHFKFAHLHNFLIFSLILVIFSRILVSSANFQIYYCISCGIKIQAVTPTQKILEIVLLH